MLPAIFGMSGLSLTSEERAFFKSSQPAGFILFARNIGDRKQLAALCAELKSLTGRDNLPILIDQEGGRVARMTPPHWLAYPAGQVFAELYAKNPGAAVEACKANYEALGLDLAEVGITVDCAPVLDIPKPGAHDVIGDRAFGASPKPVIDLGRACLDGLSAAGVVGVVKHIPGHGRAGVDSHHELPCVDASIDQLEEDLAPFRALKRASMAMTAHIRYAAWDAEECATLSKAVVSNVIRRIIGFDGWLMSDDLDMKALAGSVPELALRSLEAGCDVVLNCWGKMDDMQGIAALLPSMTSESIARMERAMSMRAPVSLDALEQRQMALIERRDALLKSR